MTWAINQLNKILNFAITKKIPLKSLLVESAGTFGPAVMNLDFEYFHIYVVAPITGGLFDPLTFYLVKEKNKLRFNKL